MVLALKLYRRMQDVDNGEILMSMSIVEKIEMEYDAYCIDGSRNLDKMYRLLTEYLRKVTATTIKRGSYVDEYMVEELVQEALLAISIEKIYTFQKEKAKFTTFCMAVAKNKALDYVRKRERRKLESYEEKEEVISFLKPSIYRNPETYLLMQEYKLEQISMLKKYLQILMNQKGKPYRIVGCCYAMVLYHRYHPDSKELSSPSWAYEEIKCSTVEESAERFVKEINAWFPQFRLHWSEDFFDAVESKEDGCCIADMVYEDYFKVKDFENWSLRMRKKIREEMMEVEYRKDNCSCNMMFSVI